MKNLISSKVKVPECVHMVPGRLWGVENLLEFIVCDEKNVLIDAGLSYTPRTEIFPFMETIGLKPQDLDYCMVTHSHLDHFGGCSQLLEANPNIKICVHKNDVLWAESHKRHYHQFFCSMAGEWDPDEKFYESVMSDCGPDYPVDIALEDDQVINIGRKSIITKAIPAHSPGHSAFYIPEIKTVFTGDALQGFGSFWENGVVVTPYYDTVERYKHSLEVLSGLDVECVCSAHLGILSREEMDQYIRDSYQHIEDFCARILDVLKKLGKPITLREAADTLHSDFYPRNEYSFQLFGATHTHLQYLRQLGKVQLIVDNGRLKWCLE